MMHSDSFVLDVNGPYPPPETPPLAPGLPNKFPIEFADQCSVAIRKSTALGIATFTTFRAPFRQLITECVRLLLVICECFRMFPNTLNTSEYFKKLPTEWRLKPQVL